MNYHSSSLSKHDRKEVEAEDAEWIVLIKNEIAQEYPAGEPPCPSIFLAPSPLRGLKHDAYVPQVVAIGPYHSDLGPHHSAFPQNQETERYKIIAAKEMEKHKIMACRCLARRLRCGSFAYVTNEFEKLVGRVRNEYDVLLTCENDEKLALLLALDATFVVEVLRSNALQSRAAPAPPAMVASKFHFYYSNRFPRPLQKSILQDFILLENQVPLFLLYHLIRMDQECMSDEMAYTELHKLVMGLAHDTMPFYNVPDHSVHGDVIKSRKHLLDCLYSMATTPSKDDIDDDLEKQVLVEKPTHFPRAVELHNCGIKFKPVDLGTMDAVAYDPRTAILYVPKVRVGDDTDRLFRNLIAYESHLPDTVQVLSYLRFMNNLVDGPDDVALLVKNGIIAQDIGSNEEVADMWNNLCMNTMRLCSARYEKIAQELVAHCQQRINAWKAELKRTYLSRPWLLISVLSAAALLVMTLLILIYTVDLYEKPGG